MTPELIRAAIAGDAKASAALAGELHEILHVAASRVAHRRRSLARGRTITQEVADFVQEVFVHLYDAEKRRLLDWDPAFGTFGAYFNTLATRHIISFLRSRKKSPWTEDPTPDFEHELHHLGFEGYVDARDGLERLEPELRRRLSPRNLALVELLFVDGMTPAEAAAVVEMTPNAVSAWRVRFHRFVRTVMSEPVAQARRHGRPHG